MQNIADRVSLGNWYQRVKGVIFQKSPIESWHFSTSFVWNLNLHILFKSPIAQHKKSEFVIFPKTLRTELTPYQNSLSKIPSDYKLTS